MKRPVTEANECAPIRTRSHGHPEQMRVLVFGGRGYPYESFVHEGLLRITDGVPFHLITIMHGACNCGEKDKHIGADYWAHTFCEQWRYAGLIEKPYPAKWDDLTVPGAVIGVKYGRRYNVRAGFMRNQYMLDDGKPTHALEAPGGTGTADMRSRIERAISNGARIDLQKVPDPCA